MDPSRRLSKAGRYNAATSNRVGIVTMSAGGTNALGFVQVASATALGVVAINASTTYAGGTSVNSGNPGTWAAGDSLTWNANVHVVRV